MIKIYGSMLCPDCVKCREDLDRANVAYTYLDFSENLKHLKEFLLLRDTEKIFDATKEKGSIGIPCIVCEDGQILLDWQPLM